VGDKGMKKQILIFGVAVLLISVGLSGCQEKVGTDTEGVKRNEFTTWQYNTSNWLKQMDSQVLDSFFDREWDDCLYYCGKILQTIPLYRMECRDFFLTGILDDARDEFTKYLSILNDAYLEYELAYGYYKIGDNRSGNLHMDIALDYDYQIHLNNCNENISEWRKR